MPVVSTSRHFEEQACYYSPSLADVKKPRLPVAEVYIQSLYQGYYLRPRPSVH